MQDWLERYYMGVGVPAVQSIMKALHVEDGVSYKMKKSFLSNVSRDPFDPPDGIGLMSPYCSRSCWTVS